MRNKALILFLTFSLGFGAFADQNKKEALIDSQELFAKSAGLAAYAKCLNLCDEENDENDQYEQCLFNHLKGVVSNLKQLRSILHIPTGKVTRGSQTLRTQLRVAVVNENLNRCNADEEDDD